MSAKPRKKRWISQREAKAALRNHFEEFVVDGDLLSFTDHAGIKLRGVHADDVWDRFLGHFRTCDTFGKSEAR